MGNNKLNHILAQGENDQVEFKLSFNKETIETLVSFANTKGGKVYIGISKNGEISGISIHNESCQNWLTK